MAGYFLLREFSGTVAIITVVGDDESVDVHVLPKGVGDMILSGYLASLIGSGQTRIGEPGDIAYGDGTLRVIHPTVDLMMDLGKSTNRFNEGWFGGFLNKLAGNSTSHVRVGGTLHVNTTAVGNVGAGPDVLMTYTVPGNVLSGVKDSLRIRCAGTFAANANSKQLKLIYGATTLFDTTAQLQAGGSWEFDAVIVRTGAATQKAICRFVIGATTMLMTTKAEYTTPAETLSGTVVLKCEATTATANNDIVQELCLIEWLPASEV
jgi:hypothetical protein